MLKARCTTDFLFAELAEFGSVKVKLNNCIQFGDTISAYSGKYQVSSACEK
jgi:hypothetical protein